MPKARETCTRCSMRRQKCDRNFPCSRCVQAGVADECTREWREGYDARVHRKYHARPPPATEDGSQSVSDTSPRDIASVCSDAFHSPERLSRQSRASRQPSGPPAVNGKSSAASLQPSLGPGSANESGARSTVNDDLQSLVPTSQQIISLVDYHERSLLWYHGCLSGASFRRELHAALQGRPALIIGTLDSRWAALLFAIMAAGLACARDGVAAPWGFSKSQKDLLSRKWYQAAHTCLSRGDYTAQPHMTSLQAIQVLSISAHSLGASTQQFIMFGAALRIAQSLGLHQLPYDSSLDVPPSDQVQKRDMGRRIWLALCTQDWFSVVFANMYSISKQHFSTIKPTRLLDEATAFAPTDMPLIVDYLNWANDLSALLVDFHDSQLRIAEEGPKYEQVLEFDTKFRSHGPSTLPRSFSAGAVEPWVRWAKGVAIVAHANKIIMIHRAYLGLSFTNPKYEYSRWASIAASRSVIQALEENFADQERPALWNDQSHLVGAAITLCLDMLHRPEMEPQTAENRQLVRKAIQLLGVYEGSILAMRGAQLLSSLLNKGRKSQSHNMPSSTPNLISNDSEAVAWPLEDSQDIEAIWATDDRPMPPPVVPVASHGQYPGLGVPSTTNVVMSEALNMPAINNAAFEPFPGFNTISSADPVSLPGHYDPFTNMSMADIFSDYFPPQSGLGSAVLLEELFKT